MDPIVKSIPLPQIHPSPYQARKTFDMDNLRGLAESMKQEGLLNPVVVRKIAIGYELISGERRLRAAKLLGWPTLEAKVIGTVSEAEAAAKGLIENIQREGLNTLEEAEGYQELNRLDPKYWTQSKIAQNCGKTQGHVSEFLRFLTLPDVIKNHIRRRILSTGHAVELLRIHKPKAQRAMARRIIKGKWSVMMTRDAIDKKLGKKPFRVLPLPKRNSALGPVPQTLTDPWVDVWLSLQNSPQGLSDNGWEVTYGAHQIGSAPSVNCWTFVLSDNGATSPQELAQRLRHFADALEHSARADISQDTPVEPLPERPRVSMMIPTSPDELRIMARERETLRLPKDPEEQAELEALAVQGPGAVYQWIYGKDSLTAGKVSGQTWAERGVSDPATGARGLVKALREIQELSKI